MEQDDPRREGDIAAAERDARSNPATMIRGVDWSAIERAVLHSGMSYRRIAERLGSCEKTIGHKARREGWARIVPLKALPCGRRARPPGTKPYRPTAEEIRRKQMLDRLFQVLDAKMREIEERMSNANQTGAAPQSAADAERDARSLNALARLYAKLVELDDAAKQSGAAAEDKIGNAKGQSENAVGLRQDLALRLKRLDRPGDA